MESCGEFIHSNYFLLSWTGELGLFSSKDDLGLERGWWKLFGGYSRTVKHVDHWVESL